MSGESFRNHQAFFGLTRSGNRFFDLALQILSLPALYCGATVVVHRRFDPEVFWADVEREGVTIIGHTNLPSEVPAHASQMYSKNITTFLDHLLEEGKLEIDLEDEITSGTLVTNGGAVIHEMIKSRIESAGS